MFISNSPRLFAGNHVLRRLSVPRHSPYALFRLNSFARSHKFRSCLSFANNCLGCNEKTVLSNILHHCFPPPEFPPTANCSSLFRKDLLFQNVFLLQLSVRFFPYSVFNEQSAIACALAPSSCDEAPASPNGGQGGLEDSSHTPHYALMRSVPCPLAPFGAGGLKWTRTTDLPLIRRVL